MIVCDPAPSAEVLMLASPFASRVIAFDKDDPAAHVPSKNVRVPVGVPLTLVTVAVKVTEAP